jgi:polyphosphate kinase 2 (PPK2 family)
MEGFDAAGKGGAIRKLTDHLDPRGIRVIPIGPPTPEEKGRHWLYRFWRDLPVPGTIVVFDRTWYGRVLVERVEKLCSKSDWKRAYDEINAFEAMLVEDGVDFVKIFLAITKDEQFERFKRRLEDPTKQWKITEADIRARRLWDRYVEAADNMFQKTDTRTCRWNVLPANHKWWARVEVLRIVTRNLGHHREWMEEQMRRQVSTLRKELAKLR